MKFKEINGIIDYLRSEGNEIKTHDIDTRCIVVRKGNGYKVINYKIHWETSGEYYYTIF